MDHLRLIEPLDLPRQDLIYTRCYCEENVYKLCRTISEKDKSVLENYTVVFISNPNQTIPVWNQTPCVNGNPVVWDYHVILYYFDSVRSLVYDFDSALEFPSPSDEYIRKAFLPEIVLPDRFKRYIWLLRFKCYNNMS
ncbi:N-terminal glutamine amidase-domain-containing protein [Phycomyces nitens]|nr:N-terminal glutamine amidase-domain-containing protein [Phycomyces nitens]